MTVKNLRQGRKEFDARVKRTVRAHRGYGAAAQPASGQHPVILATMGFLWFYLVIRVSQSRPLIDRSLADGTLQPTQHTVVLGIVATIIVASVVMALYLAAKTLQRQPKRRNSGGLLAGVIVAAAYCYAPPGVFAFGYDLLDSNTKDILASAGSGMKELGLTNIQAVSSWVPEVRLD